MHIGGPSMHEGCRLFILSKGFEMGYVMRFVRSDIAPLGFAHDLALMPQFADVETLA
jgi:hypothetical protein